MIEALTIDAGDVGDIDAIMVVMDAAFDPAHGEAWSAAQCAGALAIPGTRLLIARSGANVIGFALSRTVIDETELMLLAVAPDQRGHGVGSAIVQTLTGELRARGGRILFLEVRENNSARELYARLHFRQVGFRKNYYRGVSGIYTHAVTLSLAL